VLALGYAYLSALDLPVIAQPWMEKLVADTRRVLLADLPRAEPDEYLSERLGADFGPVGTRSGAPAVQR
jgi:hypothetical protein